jgi:hypothetical protein
LSRRERVPPREEDEERYRSGFDEEEDRDFIVSNSDMNSPNNADETR